ARLSVTRHAAQASDSSWAGTDLGAVCLACHFVSEGLSESHARLAAHAREGSRRASDLPRHLAAGLSASLASVPVDGGVYCSALPGLAVWRSDARRHGMRQIRAFQCSGMDSYVRCLDGFGG